MIDTPNPKPNSEPKTTAAPAPEVKTESKPTAKKPVTNSKFATLLKEIEKMTIQDLNTFVKEIQDHFDIQPIAAAASEGAATADAKPDKVSVIITEAGQSKVALIKAVGVITGKGLMDSKKILDTIPATIATDTPTAEATEMKKQLEDAGATVQLK